MHEFQQIAGLPEFLASPEKKRRHARCYVHAGRPVTQLVLKLFLQNLREHFAQPLNPMVTHRIVTAQSLYCNRRKESRFVAHKPAFLQNDFGKEVDCPLPMRQNDWLACGMNDLHVSHADAA